MSSLSAKISTLKAKTSVLEVKEVKVPESNADFLELFESNSSPKFAQANEWIIDVFPNQIPIICFLMKLAASVSSKADHKDNSKSSLATFCMYYVTILQAFFLLSDLHVRPSPSAHAQSWSTIGYKAAFAEWLLTLPVPDHMVTILKQLFASETERTKNVFFVPSAAGFDLRHFYGRFVPVAFFAHIHDCIATMPGNSQPLAIYNDLFARVLCTIPTGYARTATSLHIADILGIKIDTADGLYMKSKFYQIFQSVFNTVLFRDFHRRSSLATIDLDSVNFKATKNINAYDLLFSANPHNLRELKVVLQHVSTVIQSSTKCSKNLGTIISEATGNQIIQHGYSTYATPTWYLNTTRATLTSYKAQSTTDRAELFKFPSDHAATPAVPGPSTITAAIAGGHASAVVSGLTFPWSLVMTSTSASPHPADDEFVKFDDDVHTYPKVLVLDTSGQRTVAAHLATLSGKIIESFELDGTTIPVPNALRSLASQNCLFADSAIPFDQVVRATKFPGSGFPAPLNRSLPKPSSAQAASTLIHDRTKIFLPKIPGNGTAGEADIRDSVTYTSLPGMTPTGAMNWIAYAQSFLGFYTKHTSSASDAPPSTSKGRFLVWSPYTYVSMEDSDPSEVVPDLTENRIYFLTNLRTIFGTDYNLVEVVHPLEAMPV